MKRFSQKISKVFSVIFIPLFTQHQTQSPHPLPCLHRSCFALPCSQYVNPSDNWILQTVELTEEIEELPHQNIAHCVKCGRAHCYDCCKPLPTTERPPSPADDCVHCCNDPPSPPPSPIADDSSLYKKVFGRRTDKGKTDDAIIDDDDYVLSKKRKK